MPIRKFRASRVNSVTSSEFVGQHGDVFYDEDTGQFRVSDGTTPGGHIVQTTLNLLNGTADVFVNNIVVNGTSTTINNIVSNNETTVTGVLTVTGNASFTGNTEFVGTTTFTGPIISVGTRTSQGNSIFNGNVTTNGNLVVEGPSYFFGNITEVGNLVITGKAINNGPSIFNGSMTIAGDTSMTGNVVQSGVSKFIVSTDSMNYGALTITGNVQGLTQPPALPGVMLHVTGQDNGTTPARVYVDANRQYSIIVGRRYNGTVANPTQALAGDEVLRIAGTGYPTGGWPLTGLAQIRYIADENQTQTNRGGHIDFLTVPIGSNVVTQVMSLSATTGANIAGNLIAANVTATNFFGTATQVSNSLTAGYGLKLSSGTTYNGSTALTLNKYDAITSATATGSGANGWTYSLDLGTATGTVIVDAGGNFSGTVTIAGTPIAGKVVRLIVIGGIKGATTVTVSGLTAGNSSNGLNTFTATTGTASSVIVEFISSNTSLGGVYMNTSGAK